MRSVLFSHDLQKRVTEKEEEKQEIQEDTKELAEKNNKLAEEMKEKNQGLKNVEKYDACIPASFIFRCSG